MTTANTSSATSGMNKWIELIRVRSSADALRQAMAALESFVGEIAASLEGTEIFFMRHGLYEGDLAVALVWRDGRAQKSAAGLLVADRLQALGTIDHAVWIPAGPRPQPEERA